MPVTREGLQLASQSILRASKTHPQRHENRSSEGPKSNPDHPQRVQERPRTSKSPPRAPEERPRGSQERPKRSQERLKSALRIPQLRPSWPQEASQGAPESSWRPFGGLQAQKKYLSQPICRATRSRIVSGSVFPRCASRARKCGRRKNMKKTTVFWGF